MLQIHCDPSVAVRAGSSKSTFLLTTLAGCLLSVAVCADTTSGFFGSRFSSGTLAGLLLLIPGQPLPSLSPVLAAQVGGFAVWMAIAMWTTMYGVTHLEAGRSGVLIVAELVVAALSAMLIAGERLEGLEWVGAGLIVTAAAVEARGKATPGHSPADA